MSDQAIQPRTLNGIQRLLEGGLIVCCALALYLLAALGSFHPADPGWSQTAWDGQIHNLMGRVGAWLADLLYFSFGLSAWSVPLLTAVTGWLMFRRSYRIDEIDYFSVALRIVGLLLMLLGFSTLASMNADDIYYFSAGGVIGDVIRDAMLPYFNLLGTTLLLLCFVGAGFTLFTGLSWATVVEAVGFGVITAVTWLWRLPSRLMNRDRNDDGDADELLQVAESHKQRTSSQPKPGRAGPVLAEEAPEPAATDDELSDWLDKVPLLHRFAWFKRFVEWYDERVYGPQEEQDEALTATDESVPLPEALKQAMDGPRAEPKLSPLEPLLPETLTEPFPDEAPALSPEPQAGAVEPAPKPAPAPKAASADQQALTPAQMEAQTLMPTLELLDRPHKAQNPISQEELDQIARLVELKLADFNVVAKVVDVHPGPVITRFELDLAPGVKVSKITNLAKDLARALSAVSVRVVEVIPGKSVIGLELPNKSRETVFMRDVLGCEQFEQSKSNLAMVLGQDISGYPVVVDLGKMPHLLVAGTTGSGKSVGVNAMIVSLLYKSTPEDVRLIMIDPKMLELSVYEGIPHLLCEVVTDMKEAANALRWCVGEMERRYKLMSAMGVRNLKGYNAKILEAQQQGQPLTDPFWQPTDSMDLQPPELEKLPSIVVVVDEFADMMMIVGKKVEELIARIAQKARAAGIHLILATQRPSVDVITGLIKANIPTRIAFQVSSRVDSRTILDQQGAEQLLGQGDMLYLPPGTGVPVRVHGAFVDDHEVHRVVADWCARGKPNYIEEILAGESGGEQVLLPGESSDSEAEKDALYDEAVAFVIESRRASISSVQRKLKIGYNRAARMVEEMEQSGLVSAPGHNGNREVLVPARQ
ncbi:DNA translocase FtsK [Ferrimonas sp. SCSIO 43195]|uniref:DNA translocase FtsK n=1 Tax=Ferrimonas sp. SCSIO 43195 TaxID=2822844 RepID=UPI00207539A1|nr:DNA translocase FtsK 4TM domain-containing protein [Ferrimonas sp. SCSIO 43195]USD38979.1 DNA translocase FtsK 4TM domain-containing protein [Ferrimonas sp. SCSIO 43195]